MYRLITHMLQRLKCTINNTSADTRNCRWWNLVLEHKVLWRVWRRLLTQILAVPCPPQMLLDLLSNTKQSQSAACPDNENSSNWIPIKTASNETSRVSHASHSSERTSCVLGIFTQPNVTCPGQWALLLHGLHAFCIPASEHWVMHCYRLQRMDQNMLD